MLLQKQFSHDANQVLLTTQFQPVHLLYKRLLPVKAYFSKDIKYLV